MPNKTSFILPAIIAVASILRLWQLGIIPGTFGDEIVYFLTAKKMFFGHFPLMLHSAHGTFIAFLMALSSYFFGLNTFAGRLPLALMGIATVGIFYFLGKGLFNRKIGLLAALLVAVSPWHVGYSRIAWISVSTLFFSSLSMLLILRGIDRKSAMIFFLAGISMGLGLHDHQYSVFLILIIMGMYTVLFRRIKPVKILKGRYFWIMAAGILIPVAPLAYYNAANGFVTVQYFFGHQTHTFFGELSTTSSSAAGSLWSRYAALVNTFRYSINGNNIMVDYWIQDSLWLWSLIFMISLLAVIYLSLSKNSFRSQNRLIISGLLISALIVPFFAGYGKDPAYGLVSSSHYLEPLFAFAFIIMAAGIAFISERISSFLKRRDLITFAAAIVISILSVNFLASGYFSAFENSCPSKDYNPTLIKAVDYVGGEIRGKAVVVDDFNFGEFLSGKDVSYYYYENSKNYYDFNLTTEGKYEAENSGTLDIFFVFSPFRNENGTVEKSPNLLGFEKTNPGLKPSKIFPSCSKGEEVAVFHVSSFEKKYSKIRFDFGDTSSPLEEGYARVSQLTPYTPILGYGWDWTITDPSGLRLNTRRVFNSQEFLEFNEYGWHSIPVRNATQFYSPQINDSILADGFVIFADSTFKVDVRPGRYKIKAVMASGEADEGKPRIKILTEEKTLEQETEPNKITNLVFEAEADEQLEILFRPVNSNLIIFALSIEKL